MQTKFHTEKRKKMLQKKKVVFFVMLVFAVIFSWFWIFSRPSNTVRESRIPMPLNEPYVMCKFTRVTGYDWEIWGTNVKSEKYTYCRLEGAGYEDFQDFGFHPEFLRTNTVFLFYVTGYEERFDEQLDENVIYYKIHDWDVKFPVWHAEPAPFASRRFITTDELCPGK